MVEQRRQLWQGSVEVSQCHQQHSFARRVALIEGVQGDIHGLKKARIGEACHSSFE